MEIEIKDKNELIEEANKCIEEFYDEKNQIKAKFKHLMQLLDDPSIFPEEESSFKEDDNISLNDCFKRLEEETLKHRRHHEAHLRALTDENERLKAQMF